jgi:hypothetical protein
MPSNRRQNERVQFEFGYDARVMAIDGTWQRACLLADVSESGGRIVIKGSIKGLALQEFFLVLSCTGNAHRRCQLAWINGDEVGVLFPPKHPQRKNRLSRRQPADDAEPRPE